MTLLRERNKAATSPHKPVAARGDRTWSKRTIREEDTTCENFCKSQATAKKANPRDHSRYAGKAEVQKHRHHLGSGEIATLHYGLRSGVERVLSPDQKGKLVRATTAGFPAGCED
jgi:hypothetical protein